MTTLPSIHNYGQYQSNNYGAHTLEVNIGRLTLWYSYSTVVAFRFEGVQYVSENIWSTTTGKHLNWIDGGDKKGRLPHREFVEKLQSVLQQLNLLDKS